MKRKTLEQRIDDYLEDLRDSGAVNMYGAVPYLMNEFGLTRKEAKEYLFNWFDKE